MTTAIDWKTLEQGGLFEADAAPDGLAIRKALVEYLVSLGASTEQLLRANHDRQLAEMSAELVVGASAGMTLAEAAESAGVSIEIAEVVYRVLGLSTADLDEPKFGESDVELLDEVLSLPASVGYGVDEMGETLRVFGSLLSRMADAAVAVYRQGAEQRLSDSGADELARAHAFADAAQAGINVPVMVGVMLRHHVMEALQRQRSAVREGGNPASVEMAVGFVDLAGFTPLSAQLDVDELVTLISNFENRSIDIVNRHGGQVVKHLGDEIMFVTSNPADGCAIALDLMDAFSDDQIEPHGGIAWGDLVMRRGDYYGPIVNLASRIVDQAIRGEILVTDALAQAVADPAIHFAPAGRREVRGFAEPVTVSNLTRGPT
jgi:adenylate cyclase